MSRKQLSDLVNCKAGISPTMAIRLEKAFGGQLRLGIALSARMTWRRL